MARNKRPQAADEKRAEIVAAARRLFIDDGYDATSMSRLAKDAGVAPNTIYWYFGDKDDVLIAVLTAVMADVWPQYQVLPASRLRHGCCGSSANSQMSRLVTTVHAASNTHRPSPSGTRTSTRSPAACAASNSKTPESPPRPWTPR